MFSGKWIYGVLACVFSIVLVKSDAQGFLRVAGQKIVNEKGENVLLRGMGLGGWMLQEGYMLRVNGEGQQYRIRARIKELVGEEKTQEFYDAWLSNHTRKIDIDSMKAWGFNSVRLPMHYNLYTLPVSKEPVRGEQTWIEKGFAMTDSLLSWCKANGMYLILDLHAAPGGQGNDLNISDRDPAEPSLWESEENRNKTIALWKKLAERYVNEPWIGAYDIINEPNWGFEDPVNDRNGLKEQKNEPLKKLMLDITKAIREVDQKHIIIIEGNGWGNNYNGILPPWDQNMVLSFHKYWNFNDVNAIRHILDTREKYNVPVWLGETGENSNVWFADAIRLLESHNIGWAWWPLKKLGINNPMHIQSNPGYDQILSYWAGRGSKPSGDEAYEGIMKLAAATRLENTHIKRDVIDAMFRQPFSDKAIPFKQHRIKETITVNAVDYDLGRNRSAYFDMDTANYHVSTGKRTPGNRGNVYRNDGVDIQLDSASKNFYVSHFEKGEWLQYTVEAAETGSYHLTLQLRADTASVLSMISNGRESGRVTIAQSKEWKTSGNVSIQLKKGWNTIRIISESGRLEFQSMRLQRKGK